MNPGDPPARLAGGPWGAAVPATTLPPWAATNAYLIGADGVAPRAAVDPDLEPAAHELADRAVLAHLRKLMRETRVMHLGDDAHGPFARAPGG